jgi:phage protein U
MLMQLGPVQFQTTGPVAGMQFRREYPFAEHATAEGKPHLQAVGDGLESLTLELSLMAALGDVAAQLAELERLAGLREPLALVTGAGEYRGRYVVRDLDVTVRETDAAGVLTGCGVRVGLSEFVDRPGVEERRAEPLAVASRQGGSVKRAQPARPPAVAPGSVPASQITRQARR